MVNEKGSSGCVLKVKDVLREGEREGDEVFVVACGVGESWCPWWLSCG